MTEAVKERKKFANPPVVMQTCECRLIGNGVDMHIAHVTLPDTADSKRYAKKAYSLASASLRNLEPQRYHILVIGENMKDSYALETFKR